MPSLQVNNSWWQSLPSSSFLEYAFLRWVLGPSVSSAIIDRIIPQAEIKFADRLC